MRGRKQSTAQYPPEVAQEEIDNPRMRGRKLPLLSQGLTTYDEEIDNPRMRGRKHVREAGLKRG